MIMEKLNRLASHEIGGNFRDRAVFDDFAKLRDTLPVTIVIKKPAAFMGIQIFSGVFSGLSHVALDTCSQGFQLVCKEAADQDNSVALEGVDMILSK